MLPPLPPLRRRPAGTGWMVTLADLVALLLAFFVMLYSMSAPRPDRLRAIAEGMVGRVATERARPSADAIEANTDLAEPAEGHAPAYLVSVLRRTLAADPLFAAASVQERGGDLVIAVPLHDGLPKPEALRGLAPMLERIGNRMTLVVATGSGPDGWRRSMADAGRLARALGEAGFSGRVPLLGARLTDGPPRIEIVIADRVGTRG